MNNIHNKLNHIEEPDRTHHMYKTYETILKCLKEAVNSIYDKPFGNNVNYNTEIVDLISSACLDEVDLLEIEMYLTETFNIGDELDNYEITSFRTVYDFIKKIATFTGNLHPVVPTAPTAHMNDLELGILILPSLENHGRLIDIRSISISEANHFLNNFNTDVLKLRKCKIANTYDSTDDINHMEFYHNVINLSQLKSNTDFASMNSDVEELTKSTIPKTRGIRALFVSPTVVGIGTTVIYNKNWATTNFSDHTVYDRIKEIADRYA